MGLRDKPVTGLEDGPVMGLVSELMTGLVNGLGDGPAQGNADDQWGCVFQSTHSFFLAAGDKKGYQKVNRILLRRGHVLYG